MRKIVIGLAMASTALATPAMSRDGQWYVGVEGGAMIVEDIEIDVTDFDNDGTDTRSLDTEYGYDFGGFVGYDFGAFRLEAEASYRAADIDTFTVGRFGVPIVGSDFGEDDDFNVSNGTFDSDGDVNALSFMLNGLFDFGPDDGLQGFVGGGVGVARVDVDGNVFNDNNRIIDDSDTGLAWQILAGVRAPLSDNVDVGLRYRMFTAEDVDLVDNTGFDNNSDLRTHSILGTLTYNFGGAPEPVIVPVPAPAPAPAPVPAPAPAPTPAPVCNTGPYIVFFNWDESEITPDAARTLDNAVSSYADCGMASVMLAGHTDTSGTMVYNEGLSQRRNSSVRAYLASRGIPDGRIASEAFGETQNRVPTADGVRELQNRRVEITYGPGSGM